MSEAKRGICTDNSSYPSRVIAKGLVSMHSYHTPFESSRGVTVKFFRGRPNHFSRYFPGVILAFSWWKAKKKVLSFFGPFTTYIFHFPPSLFHFSPIFPHFLRHFHKFLPSCLALFFPISCLKFPGGKSLTNKMTNIGSEIKWLHGSKIIRRK